VLALAVLGLVPAVAMYLLGTGGQATDLADHAGVAGSGDRGHGCS